MAFAPVSYYASYRWTPVVETEIGRNCSLHTNVCVQFMVCCVLLTAHSPVRTIHAALCTRVLLNLRAAAARSSGIDVDDYSRNTTLQFHHNSMSEALLPRSHNFSREPRDAEHYELQTITTLS